MTATPHLSIVIPLHNEVECVEWLVADLLATLRTPPAGQELQSFEIILVDDGSTDGTTQLLHDLAAAESQLRLVALPHRLGQSGALWQGFLAARGDILVTLDGDGQMASEDIWRLLHEIDEGAEFVIGQRVDRQDVWSKRWFSRAANGFRKWLLRSCIPDSGCSLRAFRRELLSDFFPFQGLHRFLPSLAELHERRLAVVAVQHRARQSGRSKYGILGRAACSLGDCAMLWWIRQRRIRPHDTALHESNNLATSKAANRSFGLKWLALGLWLLYGLLLFVTLDWHEFWLDEIYTLEAIDRSWYEVIEQRASRGHPPLFFLLEKAVVDSFGTSPYSVRAIAVLAAMGSAFAVYRLLRLGFSGSIAFAAAILFACSPAQLTLAQIGRSYTLLQCLSLAAIWLALRTPRPRLKTWCLVTLLFSLAIYSHNQALVWIPVLCGAVFLVSPRSAWPILVAGGIAIVVYWPYTRLFPVVVELSQHAVSSPSTWVDWLILTARWWSGRYTADLGIVITVAFALGCLFALWKSNREPLPLLALVTTLLTYAALCAAKATGSDLLLVERYFAPLYFIPAVALAVLLRQFELQTRARAKWAKYAPACIAGVSATVAVAIYAQHAPFSQDRQVAELLYRERTLDQPLVFYFYNPSRRKPLEYYYPTQNSSIQNSNSPLRLPDKPEVWVYCMNRDQSGYQLDTEPMQQAGYSVAFRKRFESSELLLFRR